MQIDVICSSVIRYQGQKFTAMAVKISEWRNFWLAAAINEAMVDIKVKKVFCRDQPKKCFTLPCAVSNFGKVHRNFLF